MSDPFSNGGGARRPDPEQLINEIFANLGRRLPGNALGPILLGIALLLWTATGIYQVNPNEMGVVLRFGAVQKTTGPGLHWHMPWPVERVLKPPVTLVLKEEMGFRTVDPGPPARYRPVTEEARMITTDGNIVDLDFIVQYRIKDPVDFLFKVRDPAETLRDAAESAMREVIGRTTIDNALTEGRLLIQTEAQKLLQETLDSYESGLLVTTVKLQDVVPPGPVQDAFKDVISAEQDRERMINEAEGFANDILPKARGTAAQLLNEAEGHAASVTNEAEGAAKRFELLLTAYLTAPNVTRKRMYLETMEAILPGMDKIIMDTDGTPPLPLLPLKPLLDAPKETTP
jgi:membrane protease subunit HflK